MKIFRHIACTLGFSLLFPVGALATLGESVNSQGKNLSSLKASQKVGSSEKYSAYEYEQNGNTVKEFSNSAGIVFAVSWKGISKPDFQALFGSYYSEYQDAFKSVPKQYGVKSVSVQTSRLAIRRGGRMRDQRGFVYIPSLVPEGVQIEELK